MKIMVLSEKMKEKSLFKPRKYETKQKQTRNSSKDIESNYTSNRAAELRRSNSKETIRIQSEVERLRRLDEEAELQPLRSHQSKVKVVGASESLYNVRKPRELAQLPQKKVVHSVAIDTLGSGFSRRAVKNVKKKSQVQQVSSKPHSNTQKSVQKLGQQAKQSKPEKIEKRDLGKVYYSIDGEKDPVEVQKRH